MNYYDAALNYEMTTDEAMTLDMSREPLWKIRTAAAHLSTLPTTEWKIMAQRQMRQEALEGAFWERKYAGEPLG